MVCHRETPLPCRWQLRRSAYGRCPRPNPGAREECSITQTEQTLLNRPWPIWQCPVLECEHVGGIAPKPACFDRVGNRRLVDQRASGRVDQQRSRLDQVETITVYELPRAVGQRHRQDDEIALDQNLLGRRRLHAGCVRRPQIIGQQASAFERPQALHQRAPDGAEAQEPDRAAGQPGAIEPGPPTCMPATADERVGRKQWTRAQP